MTGRNSAFAVGAGAKVSAGADETVSKDAGVRRSANCALACCCAEAEKASVLIASKKVRVRTRSMSA